MEGSVTKGEFAAMIGVSPGRVSQYLAEGKITPAALVGTGRNAKIIVDQAKADLRLTLDVAQRLGNGIHTNLDPAPSQPARSDAARQGQDERRTAAAGGIDYEIKLEKLEQVRRANRNAAVAEAQDKGRLTSTEDAQAQMTRVAAAMLNVFDGGLNDIAMAVAAAFKLPQRDVKHLMRQEFRKVRATASEQMSKIKISLPETVAISIEGEDPDASELQ